MRFSRWLAFLTLHYAGYLGFIKIILDNRLCAVTYLNRNLKLLKVVVKK